MLVTARYLSTRYGMSLAIRTTSTQIETSIRSIAQRCKFSTQQPPETAPKSHDLKQADLNQPYMTYMQWVREDVGKRLDRTDTRIDDLKNDMNQKFKDVEKKIDGLKEDMNQKFKDVDKKIDGLKEDMNQKFDAVDKRFDIIDLKFTTLEKNLTESMNKTVNRIMIVAGLFISALGVVLAGYHQLTQDSDGRRTSTPINK